MKTRTIIITVLLVLLCSPVVSTAEDVLVVAHNSVAVSSLKKTDIKQIFLGQKTTWADGSKITFVVQDRTKAGDAFLEKYLNTTAAQYDLFWKKQVFTGKGKSPYSFSSNHELVDFVSRTPGAIGYVLSGTSTEDVKVVEIQ